MSCPTGKSEFNSENGAKRALKHPAGNNQGRMHAYLCGDCSSWHIGHGTQLGNTWREKLPRIEGYGRPDDVVAGFILVGTHQVVFGAVCLTMTGPPADDRRLLDLDIPESLLDELTALGDQHVVDTLLSATPDELDQITNAWKAMHHS